MNNISSIYKNFFHCHKNTQHNTLHFGSKLLYSSGETTQLDYCVLCGLLTGYLNLKISGVMVFHLALKFPWMDLFCKFYDGKELEHMCTTLSQLSIVYIRLQTTHNWKLASILPHIQIYKTMFSYRTYTKIHLYLML
jgi:hypothetical protein